MVLNIQPVVPFRLSDDWNLITRTIVPVASQFDLTGPSTSESGLGDSVVTAFLSPSKGRITWGVGPAFLVPTATDDALGSGKLGIGPSVVALRQSGGWTVGGLANHLVSVAGSEDRAKVNATFVNPFLAYNWRSGAGVTLNVEYTHDWENDVDVLVVNFPTLTGLTRFGSQTVSFSLSPRFHFAPETRPDYGVRAAVILVFPK
jgi:hypothetical protein